MHRPTWSSAKVERKVWIEKRRVQRKAAFSVPCLRTQLGLVRAAMKYQARFQAQTWTFAGPVVVVDAVDLPQQLAGADVSN